MARPRAPLPPVARWSDDGQVSKKKQPADPLAAVKARRAPTCIGIRVPDGWVPLMLELHEALVAVSPDFEYVQIKQKWAELRVYVSGATPEARDIIAVAELASRTICEVCGEPGKPCQSRGGWFRALCTAHCAAAGYTEVES